MRPMSAAVTPVLVPVLVLGILLGSGTAAPASAQRAPSTEGACEAEGVQRTASPDRRRWPLYCIQLFPTPAAEDASGTVRLQPAASPFGAAVTPEGHQVHVLSARISGLPAPDALGEFTTYVAWATPPDLEPTVRLGEIRNGRNVLDAVPFDKFLVLITAEASGEVEERGGRLVLRGRSPANRMEAHDLLLQAPGALRGRTGREGGGGAAGRTRAGEGWGTPPIYPGVATLPGLADLEPSARPFLPTTDSVGRLPEARPRELIELGDGATLDLEAGLVRRRIRERTLLMFAFNGQHPGPLIRVPEEATLTVNFRNRTPLPTTVHWHGVRLDNRFDGVPGVTQAPVPPGGSFRYRVHFEDPGIYWYHPHHREDIQQELGLYGNMVVEPPEERYYSPVNREEVLLLDDLLLGEAGPVPFGEDAATHALMGRFGNVFLVDGEPEWERTVRRGEVVRFFLTNAANTRTFNLSFLPGADPDRTPGSSPTPGSDAGVADSGGGAGGSPEPLPVKVVGSDLGKLEREVWARNVVLAPAERYIVEVRFPEAGTVALVNRVQAIDHRVGVFRPERSVLGRVHVSEEPAREDHAAAFRTLRENPDVQAEVSGYREALTRPPDRELVLTMETDDLPGPVDDVMRFDWLYFPPVEWAGTMPVMNWLSTAEEVRWILRDPRTGLENGAIDWRHRVGDRVKIRLRNDRRAFHAMQHPIHVHGQRFLVLARDGVPNENLVWKDTVLVPTGSTADILLELTNPGRWMVHCHIAEHLEAGMRFVLDVEASP